MRDKDDSRTGKEEGRRTGKAIDAADRGSLQTVVRTAAGMS